MIDIMITKKADKASKPILTKPNIGENGKFKLRYSPLIKTLNDGIIFKIVDINEKKIAILGFILSLKNNDKTAPKTSVKIDKSIYSIIPRVCYKV